MAHNREIRVDALEHDCKSIYIKTGIFMEKIEKAIAYNQKKHGSSNIKDFEDALEDSIDS